MKLTSLGLTALAVAVLFTSCDAPTDTKDLDKDPVVSTPVLDYGLAYTIAGDTAVKHPGFKLEIKPAWSDPAKTITQAVVTYAVTANAVDGGLDGSSWSFADANWAKAWATGTNDAVIGGAWLTATLTSADIAAAFNSTSTSGSSGNATGVPSTVTSAGDINLEFWSNWAAWADIADGHFYVKSIVLSYSDDSSETILPGESWVGAGSDAWRLATWTPDAGKDGMTVSAPIVSTVNF